MHENIKYAHGLIVPPNRWSAEPCRPLLHAQKAWLWSEPLGKKKRVCIWVVPQGMPGARKLFAVVPTGRPGLVQGGGRPAYPLKGSWRGVRHGGLGPCNCRSHEDSARSDGTILPGGHPPPARLPPKPAVCLPQPRLGPLGKRRLRVGYSLGEYTWAPLF